MAISQDKVRTIITIPKDLKKKLDKVFFTTSNIFQQDYKTNLFLRGELGIIRFKFITNANRKHKITSL